MSSQEEDKEPKKVYENRKWYRDCCLPFPHYTCIPYIDTLPVYDDDIWVVTKPKAGTTWTQQLVRAILTNCDQEKMTQQIDDQFPFIELNPPPPDFVQKQDDDDDSKKASNEKDSKPVFPPGPTNFERAKNMLRPRWIKTHLTWNTLPSAVHQVRPKIIYCTRNPKDTCVSHYHFMDDNPRQPSISEVPFEQFATQWMEGEIEGGCFWNHVLPFWEHSQKPESNVLFITYEDLAKNFEETAQKVSAFLLNGQKLDEEQLENVKKYCNFRYMKENATEQHAHRVRKGGIGGWESYFTPELNAKFNAWTQQKTKHTNLTLQEH